MKKLLILAGISFLMISCKKEIASIISETERDQKVAEENSIAEVFSDDASVISDEAYDNDKLVTRSGGSLLGDTVRIIRNADSTITVDFGSVGITGRDGKVRRGQIKLSFTKGYRFVGAAVTQTFQNYAVNGYGVSGTRTITYNGMDTAGRPNWSIVAALTITNPSGKTMTWNSTRTRTMIAGYSTPRQWNDDEYLISGTASGTTTNGDNYSITITKPLYIRVTCNHIIDGKINYTRDTRSMSIDYGYGNTTSCDNQAELTLPNGTKVIIRQ